MYGIYLICVYIHQQHMKTRRQTMTFISRDKSIIRWISSTNLGDGGM
jgi:hypothetical protein